MSTSQNGWPVLQPTSDKLHTWKIPTKNGLVQIRLRNGSAGFVLAHFACWYADRIEPLVGGVLDDWGHNVRTIRGQTTGYSNHASGTAEDLNATKHPLGRFKTFTTGKVIRLHARLAWYSGVLRWGGDYHNRKDEMHVEINKGLAETEKVARRLLRTPRGRKILAMNPGQKAVILS